MKIKVGDDDDAPLRILLLHSTYRSTSTVCNKPPEVDWMLLRGWKFRADIGDFGCPRLQPGDEYISDSVQTGCTRHPPSTPYVHSKTYLPSKQPITPNAHLGSTCRLFLPTASPAGWPTWILDFLVPTSPASPSTPPYRFHVEVSPSSFHPLFSSSFPSSSPLFCSTPMFFPQRCV